MRCSIRPLYSFTFPLPTYCILRLNLKWINLKNTVWSFETVISYSNTSVDICIYLHVDFITHDSFTASWIVKPYVTFPTPIILGFNFFSFLFSFFFSWWPHPLFMTSHEWSHIIIGKFLALMYRTGSTYRAEIDIIIYNIIQSYK